MKTAGLIYSVKTCFLFNVGVLIHMSSVGICVISRVHPSDQLAVLHGKIFNVGHSAQTLQPHLSMLEHAMLIGTIDF